MNAQVRAMLRVKHLAYVVLFHLVAQQIHEPNTSRVSEKLSKWPPVTQLVKRGGERFNSGRPAPAVHRKPLEQACFPNLSLRFLTLQMSPDSFITSTAAPAIFLGKAATSPSGSLSGFCICIQPCVANPELKNPPPKTFTLAKFPAFLSLSVSNLCPKTYDEHKIQKI